jgi:hydroxylaminobenzene mutase
MTVWGDSGRPGGGADVRASAPPGGVAPGGFAPAGGARNAGRHPTDPEPVLSTKAVAVLALGIIAVALMACGGGLVPGLVGIVLVRPTRTEISAASGFLTGSRALRVGEVLNWIALGVSAIVIALVVVGLLIGSVGGDAPQYGNDVN